MINNIKFINESSEISSDELNKSGGSIGGSIELIKNQNVNFLKELGYG